MNVAQQALLDRLNAFEFDEPGTELTFTRRLARENGWRLAYAERVIKEYRRFLFLACVAGHVVTPSEQVDQAWHLHLTYTRSYWDDLCRNVLCQPLHHGPTKGGRSEQEKFVDLYKHTLTSYRKLFGEEPPRDIWSPVEQRFGADLQRISVNTQRYWVVPKPRWPRSLTRTTRPSALALVGIPVAATTWNPLDWNGPEFLGGYIVVTIIAALVAFVVRRMLAPEYSEEQAKFSKPLDPYEAACLAAGPARSVHAAFAALVQARALQIVVKKSKVWGVFKTKKNLINQGNPLPKDAHRLERALYLAAAGPAKDVTLLRVAAMPIAEEIKDAMVKRGLLQAGAPPPLCNVASSLIMATPLLLGGAKIAVGLSRGRPVGFLVALCVLTFVAALGFLLTRSRLSAAGKVAIESLRAKYSTTRQIAASAVESLSPPDLAMSISLFGVGTLAAGPLAEVHSLLRPASGGVGDSGSSGGCVGGCGGGSGCGGGGCGGCGGS